MKNGLVFLFALLLSFGFVSATTVELINTDPAPPVAGEYSDITFRITNPSGAEPIGMLSLSIEENPFVLQVSPDASSSQLRSGESITRTLRIYIDENAPEGSLNLVTLVDRDGLVVDTSHELFVEDARRQAELLIGEIRTTPDLLLPDTDDNELRVTLQNLGEKDAELITVTLVAPERSLREATAFSMIDSIASISSGEEGVLTFTVDVDEDQRSPVPSTLELRYRTERDNSNQYDTFERTIPVVIPIDRSPYLEVVSVEPQTEFIGGTTENILRITIANSGEEEAEDVRVRLFPDISFPFVFELQSQYIGAQIKPGSEVSIDVKFEVLSEAQQRGYPVAVELESIVGSTRYAQDDEIIIDVVRAESSASSQTGPIILVVVLLAAAGIGFVTWRNRKRSTKKR